MKTDTDNYFGKKTGRSNVKRSHGKRNLAAHSALGTTLDELASRWQSEAVYYPKIDEAGRQSRLAKWNRALDAVKYYHQ